MGPLAQRQRRGRQPRIDERDLCIICNQRLPAVDEDGNEDAREAHVRECVDRRIAQTPRHRPHPEPERAPEAGGQRVVPMVEFKATEKDCVGTDGAAQECTICMEDYEIGQALVRLECFCKYHQGCITDWLGVAPKKECPVHKGN